MDRSGRRACGQSVDCVLGAGTAPGSGGFASVVRGPESVVGSFELEQFDKTRGIAVVHSTTPFNRKMECGVIVGGMTAPGDIDFVDVSNEADPDRLVVEFH